MTLYITGGQQRGARSLTAGAGRWYKYQKGLILRVDEETKHAEIVVDYVSPPEATADEEPAVLFKQGTIEGDLLYLATQTEILVFAFPSFERVGYISLPSFNDVHHVRMTPQGTLLVVSTGLDQLMEMTTEGDIIRRWNAMHNEDPWGGRFSEDIDYRKFESTKPYESHPNHVFMIDDEIWITRFKQMDAVSIEDPSRRIDIGVNRVHDGVLHEGHIYFTSVNGTVAIADKDTLKVVELIDLNDFEDNKMELGWCRGILLDTHGAWVGFSRLRPTAIRENVAWVKSGFKKSPGTHIARYDLKNRAFIDRIKLEDAGLNAVFSILPG